MLNVSQEYLDAVQAPIQRWRVKGYSLAFSGEFGEDGGAHQANEFIRTGDLLEYVKTIGAYVLKVLG